MSKPLKNTAPVAQNTQPDPVKTFKAFTIVRGNGGWIHISLDIAVDQAGNASVIKFEATEPNLKAVAIEQLKIAQFKNWSAQ